MNPLAMISQMDTWLVAVLAGGLAALWAMLHAGTISPRPLWRKFRPLIGVLIGGLCLQASLELLGRRVVLMTQLPLWGLGLLGALAVEAIAAMYRLELTAVSRWARWILPTLRVFLAGLLIFLLAQPVLVRTHREEDLRYVAVLVDDSASMYVQDTGLSLPERIRLAELLEMDVPPRPYRFEAVRQNLGTLQEEIETLRRPLEELKSVTPRRRVEYLRNHAQSMHQRLDEALNQARQSHRALRSPVDQPQLELSQAVQTRLVSVAARLQTGTVDALARAVRITDPMRRAQLPNQSEALADDLSAASSNLSLLLGEITQLAREVDAAFHDALGPELREKIDQVAYRSRAAIGRQVLQSMTGPGSSQSLLESISSKYQLRLYRFASRLEQISPDALRDPIDPEAKLRSRDGKETNLAQALESVLDSVGSEQLSGVIVVSDGAVTDREKIARQRRRLQAGDVPVASVLVGARRPPRDAAIARIQAPAVLRPGERFELRARLWAEGLKGKELHLRLMEGDAQVASRKIEVPSDSFVTQVQLGHTPEGEGLHPYRLLLDPVRGEALEQNNSHELTLAVRDDRIRLLLVEGRPRWEFRYLKNLFSDRDPDVKLQYVLLQPDRIAAEESNEQKIPAGVGAPEGQVEATALPGRLDETMTDDQRREEIIDQWLKFDVIFLGDVDPETLRDEDHRALEDFVLRKGGTLIVSAGANFMPHAWTDRKLRDLLPVELTGEASSGDADEAPARADLLEGFDRGFRLRLTGEGRSHSLGQLAEDRKANQAAWETMPEIFWRHRFCRARGSAQVLAYARSEVDPQRPATPEPGASARQLSDYRRRLREYRRNRALICLQSAGRGKVLMLTFDRTWRLRYRVGDRLHHRFWGQVMRWATADRLRGGSGQVRMGTDRIRYNTDEPIEIRARLIDSDYQPVITEDMEVRILDASGKEVRRAELALTNPERGDYSVKMDPMAEGVYTAALQGQTVQQLLEAEAGAPAGVETSFVVRAGLGEELARLGRDRDVLSSLAAATGGLVTEPAGAREILPRLGRQSQVRIFTDDWRLWDSWPLLILIFSAASAEWLVRKKVQLP